LRRRQGCKARRYALGGEPQHGVVTLFAGGELLHSAHAALANTSADTASLHGALRNCVDEGGRIVLVCGQVPCERCASPSMI